jgi:sporulation protein YhbH
VSAPDGTGAAGGGGAGRGLSLSRNGDWSLHRKGATDARRHAEKVKEALKESLAQVVAEEAILTARGDQRVKVPIRSLQLPRLRYDHGRNKHVGQGAGGAGAGGRPGAGGPAGDGPGVDYLEAEIALDDLAALVFEDLALPHLAPKTGGDAEAGGAVFREVARRGLLPNLDKRRTAVQNIRRHALAGRPARFGAVAAEDLRFRVWTPEPRPRTSAVIVAMRDVSGSMGEFEKYVSRSFYFWMLKFLRTKYERVQVAFLTHHTEAKEVDEQTFFTLGESGGTKVSAAYQLAVDLIRQRYDPARWNVYPFHFSDGDNWGDTDNRRCLELVHELLALSSAVGYGEVRQGPNRSASTLMSVFAQIADPRFIPVVIRERTGVYEALRTFFAPPAGA